MSWYSQSDYLTIRPRARKGYEAIAYEAEGRMGYLLVALEGERSNCFSITQLVGQNKKGKKQMKQRNLYSGEKIAHKLQMRENVNTVFI